MCVLLWNLILTCGGFYIFICKFFFVVSFFLFFFFGGGEGNRSLYGISSSDDDRWLLMGSWDGEWS